MSERTPLLRPAPIITTSTPDLVEPEDHVPLLEKEESTCERYLSGRWVLCYMGLWMYLLLFCARVCISMAIVCMSGLPGTPVLNVSAHNNCFELACASTTMSAELHRVGNQSPGLENTTCKASPLNDHIPRDMEGVVLSAYFYGYIVTPLLGSMVSRRLGAKRVITVAMTMSAVATLLTPAAIRFNVYMAVAVRVLLGLAAGTLIPSFTFMWGRWAPEQDRAKLVGISSSGSHLGACLGKFVSGFLCSVPLDEGWPFIFYVYGAATLLWVGLWQHIAHDTPEEHPRISDKERNILLKLHSPSGAEGDKKTRLPLKSALTNPPTIAVITSQVCDHWLICLIGTYLPIYLSEIMLYDTQTSGVLSSLPWISAFLGTWAFASLADCLHARRLISTTKSRKLFQVIGQAFPALIIIGYGFIPPELRALAVVLMVVLTGVQAASRSGYVLNRLDLAPRFAGSLAAIGNTLTCVGQIVNPLITSAIVSDQRQESWREVFFITAFISIIGCVVYLVLGSAEEQEWAKDTSLDQTILYNADGVLVLRQSQQD